MRSHLVRGLVMLALCSVLPGPLSAQRDSSERPRTTRELLMHGVIGGTTGAVLGAVVGPPLFHTPCDRRVLPCDGPAFITNGGAGGMLLGTALGSALAVHLANDHGGNFWTTFLLTFVAGTAPVLVADGAHQVAWLAALVPVDAWVTSRLEVSSARSKQAARASGKPRPPLHKSWWFSAGGGSGDGRIDCGQCGSLTADDPWKGGSGTVASSGIGLTLSQRLLVGVESTLWLKEDANYQWGGRTLRREAGIFSLMGVAQFYPTPLPVFFKGGVGLGLAGLSGGGGSLTGAGLAAQAGGGVDIRISDHVALSPYLAFLRLQTNQFTGTNHGAASLGPSHTAVFHGGMTVAWY